MLCELQVYINTAQARTEVNGSPVKDMVSECERVLLMLELRREEVTFNIRLIEVNQILEMNQVC